MASKHDHAAVNFTDPILESPEVVLPFRSHRVLGWAGVVAITFLYATGGASGSEGIVAAGGPLVAVVALIAYPLLVTVPYAYIIAELCCSFPEDGGFSVWVLNSFGPFWGFQAGYWSWVSGIMGMAMLPEALLSALSSAGVPKVSGTEGVVVRCLMVVLLSLPALGRSRVLSLASIAALGFVVLSFVAVTIAGYVHFESFRKLAAVRSTNSTTASGDSTVAIDWALLLNSVFWNFDGINMASVIGGEVQNPARTYPVAIGVVVALTFATYMLPLPAMLTAEGVAWNEFTAGAFDSIAIQLGGQVLHVLVVIGSVAAVAGEFVCGIFIESFQLCGMAENQLLPVILAWRNDTLGSPHFAVMVTLVGTLMMTCIGSNELLSVCNVFSCAVQLLIMLTAIQLRRKLPYVPRPVKVPGGVSVLCVLALLPTAMLAYITFTSFRKSTASIVMSVVALVPGLLYGGYQLYCHRMSSL